MNWMQVEAYLQHDDRAVLPLGSTEQHSYLSLTVDCILPERVAVDAAEPLGIPVFPVLAYGVTPYFREFPGSISLRVETHLAVVRDILDSMARSGFRRILIVNGHGGNAAAQSLARRMDGRSSCLPGEVPQLVERATHLGEGAGDRSGGLARIVDGELPVDAARGRRAPGRAEADGRSDAAAPARSCRAARRTWATATTAGCTSGRTTTCWRSGRSRSKRRAPC